MSRPGSIQIKGSRPLETPEMTQKRGFGVQGVGTLGPILWPYLGPCLSWPGLVYDAYLGPFKGPCGTRNSGPKLM